MQQPTTDPNNSFGLGIEVGNADEGPPQPNAAPPGEFGDDLLDEETCAIIQARIAPTTRNGYNSTNIRII
jgi:hypothetical protein